MALLISSLASAAEIRVNDKLPVLDLEPVRMLNAADIANSNVRFEADDSCNLRRGGSIKALRIEENRVLFKYEIEGPQHGTFCPSGVRFFRQITKN